MASRGLLSGVGVKLLASSAPGVSSTSGSAPPPSASSSASWISAGSTRSSVSSRGASAYWRQYNLDRFELQWQNRWQPGVTETILLENAIGLQQLVTTKNFAQGAGPWTTNLLFWIPLNDLALARYMNRSMLRGSSRFFGANLSASLPARDLEVVQGVTPVAGQFFNQSALFRQAIGPFQTVDVLYQKAPSALTAAYEKGRSGLFRLGITTTLVALTPLPWRSVAMYGGGNPMCPKMTRTSFVQQSFDFFDDCSKPKPLTVMTSPLALVLARTATSNLAIADLCAVASSTEICIAAIMPADELLETLASPLGERHDRNHDAGYVEDTRS